MNGLNNLEHLQLSFCGLKKLPEELKTLKNLKKIYLLGNYQLFDVSELGELPLLEEINLDECNIKELPRSLTNAKYLKRIYLYDNANLKNVQVLKKIPTLVEVDVTDTSVDKTQVNQLRASIRELTVYH